MIRRVYYLCESKACIHVHRKLYVYAKMFLKTSCRIYTKMMAVVEGAEEGSWGSWAGGKRWKQRWVAKRDLEFSELFYFFQKDLQQR